MVAEDGIPDAGYPRRTGITLFWIWIYFLMSVHHFPVRYRRKFKKHAFAVIIDLFKIEIGVFFHPDDVRMFMQMAHGTKMKAKEIYKNANAQAGYTKNKDGLHYYYMLFSQDNPLVGVIAHESVHVAGAICDELGVPVDMKNDETLAYMVDHIVQGCVDEIIDQSREENA